jgi:hypothetical protein
MTNLAPYTVGTAGLFPGVKQSGHEVDLSPLFVACVKNAWSCPPCAFMALCPNNHSHKFTFSLKNKEFPKEQAMCTASIASASELSAPHSAVFIPIKVTEHYGRGRWEGPRIVLAVVSKINVRNGNRTPVAKFLTSHFTISDFVLHSLS